MRNFRKNKIFAVLIIMVSLMICSSIVYANVDNNTKAGTDKSESNTGQLDYANDVDKTGNSPNLDQLTYSDIINSSPITGTNAQIVRQMGKNYDSILLTNNENKKLVELIDIFYTSIVSTEWLDGTRYAICGHINPSLEVYIIVDTQKGEVFEKYYGIGFTWNKDKLYYIKTSPHFSTDRVSDSIVDNNGTVYFVADTNITLTDRLKVSEDGQTFAFFVNDSADESRKLYVAEMSNNKLIKKYEEKTQFGDIEFNSDHSVKVTPEERYDIEQALKDKYGNPISTNIE